MVELLAYVVWILFFAAVIFFAFCAWDKKQRRVMQEEVEELRRAHARGYQQPVRQSPLDPHYKPRVTRHRNRMDEYPPAPHGVGGADAARCNQEKGDHHEQ